MMNMSTSEAQSGRDTPQPGPFGYSFLSPMDTPYEPAPAPPPGPALLDDNESNMLDNFFTTMNSNNFSSDFWMRGQQNNSDNHKPLESYNFDWTNELPPTFEGSTTSLSQPAFPRGDIEKPNGAPLSNSTDASSDILAAASMLYGNGLQGTGFNPIFDQQRQFSNQGMPGAGSSSGFNIQTNQMQPGHHESSEQPNGNPRSSLPTGFHTSEMLFDTHKPISADQRASKVRTLHWGSDISFMDRGYLAPPDQPNEEEQTKGLLDNLQCLEPQSSAANTRAPSPERTAGGLDAGTGPSSNMQHSRSAYQDAMVEDPQPKKRQKTLIKTEDDNSDEESSKPRRRSKSNGYTKPRRGSNDSFRKSKAGAKAARENLSEEQKRNNHILSEQKRRNLIRQGFDDLCSLVPGLRGGGFSKSAMLTQAADWLEDMMRGNEILRGQLAELKNMNGGFAMPR
ncbi:hypothetical protein SI65_08541 [Aspergillus cristatus]|uniref:BHLH domain-containing protein n=1 Tax=Aspergillus cristatus TaxID=573508 RepID=A0A1E3B580_ASPCR|nr:hypothetical protein SI65_08541 [Aspergillus cristatus]